MNGLEIREKTFNKAKERMTMAHEGTKINRTVYILQGISGSGKSTTTKALMGRQEQHADEVVVSADKFWDIRGHYDFDVQFIKNSHEWCFAEFIKALRNNANAIFVDNTNTSSWEYNRYIDAAEKMGYKVYLVPVHGELSEEEILECYKRNVHEVPLEAIQGQYNRLIKTWKPEQDIG